MILPSHECGLYLIHNEYKDYYLSIEQAVEEELGFWISPEEKANALRSGEVWTLQWYPHTPIGFNKLAASTLEALLEAAGAVGV